jgi:hypothetical protein
MGPLRDGSKRIKSEPFRPGLTLRVSSLRCGPLRGVPPEGSSNESFIGRSKAAVPSAPTESGGCSDRAAHVDNNGRVHYHGAPDTRLRRDDSK